MKKHSAQHENNGTFNCCIIKRQSIFIMCPVGKSQTYFGRQYRTKKGGGPTPFWGRAQEC